MFVPGLIDKIAGHGVNALYSFPVILGLSIIGCLLGTFMSKPEDDVILKSFYKNVRPWGFWGPIKAKVMQEDPAFQPNNDFRRDCVNVGVGIIWQLSMVSLPIYIVLREWAWIGAIFTLFIATSVFLKFNWYDKLEKLVHS